MLTKEHIVEKYTLKEVLIEFAKTSPLPIEILKLIEFQASIFPKEILDEVENIFDNKVFLAYLPTKEELEKIKKHKSKMIDTASYLLISANILDEIDNLMKKFFKLQQIQGYEDACVFNINYQSNPKDDEWTDIVLSNFKRLKNFHE